MAVLPMARGDDDTLAMLQSLEHGRPLLNGYSGQRPFYYAALVDALSTFPSDESLLALRDTNVQYVVTRQPFAMDGPNASAVLVRRAELEGAAIYELVWTPDLERRLSVTSAITPPPAGAAPFAIGERARYALSWEGAGTDVAGGEVTIAVEPPAYRFVVTATTAPWIERFFAARDEYVTQVDAALLPLVHTREQRHGSRHVMRAFVYDHGSGVGSHGALRGGGRRHGRHGAPAGTRCPRCDRDTLLRPHAAARAGLSCDDPGERGGPEPHHRARRREARDDFPARS